MIFKNLVRFFIIAALASCTKVIDFDLNESNEILLVVEGIITNDTTKQEIKLSLSGKFYGETELPAATGATVSISDGSNVYEFIEEKDGLYTSFFRGKIGKTYVLNIEYNGQTYTAQSTMDSVPPMDTTMALPLGSTLGQIIDSTRYEILIYTTELIGEGNHYRWEIFRNGISVTDTLGDFNFTNDEGLDGVNWAPAPIGDIEAKKGDTILVKQCSISAEAYDIYLAANLETNWRGSIFDSPPANVPSNISNGALGLFDANAVEVATTVIVE